MPDLKQLLPEMGSTPHPKCLGLAHIPPQRVSVDEDPEAIAAEATDGQRWTSTGHMAFLTLLSI
jgi:hypothetical protein